MYNSQNLSFILIVGVLNIDKTVFGDENTVIDSNWTISICFSGRSYNISRFDCGTVKDPSVGIWFVEPMKIDRACFTGGVWAVYREWCEETPKIWTVGLKSKKSGCMDRNLLQSVLGIIYLGNEKGGVSLASSKHTLFLGPMELQQKLLLRKSELHAISWGHDTSSFKVTQGSLKDGSIREFCLVGGGPQFFREYKFDATTTFGISLRKDDCRFAEDTSMHKVLPTPQSRSDIRIQHSSAYFSNKQRSVDCWNLQDSSKTWSSNRSALEVAEAVNEQSARLATKYYAHIFSQLPLPDLNLKGWKLVEMSRKVFEVVCPNSMVPKFFFDNVLILVRYLLSESFLIRPRRDTINSATLSRTQLALRNCLSLEKKFEVEPKDECAKDVLIKVHYLNGTSSFDPVDLPGNLKNNPKIYDQLIEAIWKLFLFVHYICADHFRQYSSDLSLLYEVWHELISLDLMERWGNPGNSLNMMKVIFEGIDLVRTLRNLDHCVGAAWAQSVYQGWLKRPFQVKFTRKVVVTNDLIWDGHAYCITTYAYPAIRLGYPIEKCGLSFT